MSTALFASIRSAASVSRRGAGLLRPRNPDAERAQQACAPTFASVSMSVHPWFKPLCTAFFLWSVVSGLWTSCFAQTVSLTPQNLDGWSVSGADKSALTKDTQLTLPAGAQLGHAFERNAVIVHAVSHPAFSSSETEWPILSVGPAALALAQKDSAGKFVLVVGRRRRRSEKGKKRKGSGCGY